MKFRMKLRKTEHCVLVLTSSIPPKDPDQHLIYLFRLGSFFVPLLVYGLTLRNFLVSNNGELVVSALDLVETPAASHLWVLWNWYNSFSYFSLSSLLHLMPLHSFRLSPAHVFQGYFSILFHSPLFWLTRYSK